MTFAPALVRLLSVAGRHHPTDAALASPNTAGGDTIPPQPAGAEKHPPDMGALFVLGDKMLATARRHGQSVSLLVLQLLDLPELQLLFGREAADEVVDDVMTELTRVSARKGFAVRTSADTFALLMPGTTGQELQRALQASLGRACAIELEFGEEDVLLVPDVQSRTVSEDECVEQAYRAMCSALDAQRGLELRRRDYLRQAREACTIPMVLAGAESRSDAPALEPTYNMYATLPATIPLALTRSERRI